MKSNVKQMIFMVSLSGASLLTGGFFYLVYKEGSYITNFIQEYFSFQRLRIFMKPLENNIFKYYLPDYLWGLSLGCILTVILTTYKSSHIISGIVAFISGLMFELMQYLNFIGGTFDFIDISLYFLSGLTVILLNKKGVKVK